MIFLLVTKGRRPSHRIRHLKFHKHVSWIINCFGVSSWNNVQTWCHASSCAFWLAIVSQSTHPADKITSSLSAFNTSVEGFFKSRVVWGFLRGSCPFQVSFSFNLPKWPSLKLTVRTWKWMVGIRVSFWVSTYFQGQTVSFREGIYQDYANLSSKLRRQWAPAAPMPKREIARYAKSRWSMCVGPSQNERCASSERLSQSWKNHRPSMYGIFPCSWLMFMVNAGKYAIHGWYGNHWVCEKFSCMDFPDNTRSSTFFGGLLQGPSFCCFTMSLSETADKFVPSELPPTSSKRNSNFKCKETFGVPVGCQTCRFGRDVALNRVSLWFFLSAISLSLSLSRLFACRLCQVVPVVVGSAQLWELPNREYRPA